MDLTLTPEQRAFRSVARDFLDNEVVLSARSGTGESPWTGTSWPSWAGSASSG